MQYRYKFKSELTNNIIYYGEDDNLYTENGECIPKLFLGAEVWLYNNSIFSFTDYGLEEHNIPLGMTETTKLVSRYE